MAGTKAGGRKARETNKRKYGANFYAKIGAKGGHRTNELGKLYNIGFGGDRERARVAGAKGGRKSRKTSPNPVLDNQVGRYT